MLKSHSFSLSMSLTTLPAHDFRDAVAKSNYCTRYVTNDPKSVNNKHIVCANSRPRAGYRRWNAATSNGKPLSWNTKS